MKPLALGVEAAFIQWATRAIDVVLAAEVAGEFPHDSGRVTGGEGVVQNPARVFIRVGADLEVFIQTHGVEDDS